MLGSYEGITLGSTDGKVIGTILGNVDGIILVLDVGTELVYLDGSFDASHDGRLEKLWIGYSLGCTDDILLVYDEAYQLS